MHNAALLACSVRASLPAEHQLTVAGSVAHPLAADLPLTNLDRVVGYSSLRCLSIVRLQGRKESDHVLQAMLCKSLSFQAPGALAPASSPT
jgi:hypothetical protein